MVYETLKYYVLKAWALGLSGEAVVTYVCEMADVKTEDVLDTINKLSMEMTD